RRLHSLSLARVLREEPDDIVEGELSCDNAACGARYPILDGIPVVTPDVAAVLQAQSVAIHAQRAPEELAPLAIYGPDEGQLPRLLEHLSIYLDAHGAERARPPVTGPAEAGFSSLAACLAGLARGRRAQVVVELGCSVGGGLRALSEGASL